MDLRKFIGKPYATDTCGPDSFDCFGLVVAIYKERGIGLEWPVVDPEKYFENWRRINFQDIGDLAQFTCHGHVGMYLGYNKIVHATKKYGVVIQSIENIRASVIGYYRYQNRKYP